MPTVDEIIFRFQQADAAQAELVENYIANARVEIHFQPTALDAYDIVVENRFFSDRQTTEWREMTFSLNGAKLGPQPAAVPAAAAREGAVAAAGAAPEPRLRLPPRGHRPRRRPAVLRRPVRPDRREAVALSRPGVDRHRTLRAAEGAVGADGAVAAGRLERGGADVHRRRPGRRPADLPLLEDGQPADRRHRRAEPARHEARGLQRVPRQRPVVRRGAPAGADERRHHVPRHRQGAAPPGEAGHRARGQRHA